MEMKLQDTLGHKTQIQFKRAVVNISLSATLFRFIPPPHVEVINETQR